MGIDNKKQIVYSDGLKYQLSVAYMQQTSIRPDSPGRLLNLSIDQSGLLKINEGYSWDGPSGPTLDTHTFMRGSLVHDALYELMRYDLVDKKYREDIDKLLISMCKEDGMTKLRRLIVYAGIRAFGGMAADKKNRRRLLISPL